jgi:hypothetical protein
MDIKISGAPSVTVVLQVPEPTHDSAETGIVSPESFDLILD